MKTRFLAALALLSAGGTALAQYQDSFPGVTAACPLCHLDLRLAFDFIVGVALIGGLFWILAWLETATPRALAEHLFGIAVVGVVMLLFVRFLSS